MSHAPSDSSAGHRHRHRHRLSRRASLAALGALTLAPAGSRLVRAQATPEPGAAAPLDGVPPVIRAWVAAQQAGDPAAHAALYAPDGVLEDVPNGFVARGPEILPFLQRASQGLSEIAIEVRHAVAGGHSAAVEYLFSATNTGMIPIPGAEGTRFTSRTVTVFELAAGGELIARSSDYYDAAALLAQLGAGGSPLPPAPDGSMPTPGLPDASFPTVGPPDGAMPPIPPETPTP